MANLNCNYSDKMGNDVMLEGESVREIAEQLSEGEQVNAAVYDEAGFVRGWVHSRDDWRAA